MQEKFFERMEFKLNKEKTRMIDARKDEFNYLGFTIRNQRCKFIEDTGIYVQARNPGRNSGK